VVSVPGRLAGSVRLLDGQTLPVVEPELRGLCSWSTPRLVEMVLKQGNSKDKAHAEARRSEIANFLERVYYELRNLGQAPQERALNYAATNAFQVDRVFQDALAARLALSEVDVTKSPLCRPHSDCWDVRLTFFDPSRRLDRARRVFRFTVDVSDVVPVTVGRVRQWDAY
jgi:cyanobactin maturation PatA/PatG family protease